MATRKPEDFVNKPGQYDVVTHEERYPPRGKILNNILEAVGNTPLVKLNKIPQSFGVKCQILAKCEYFNPGGSIKDRIVMRMINDAVKLGRLEKGGHLIEPSSGNTGVSLGLCCSVLGYKGTVTVADKNDGEKLVTMKALGLDMVKTPSAVAWDDPESYFSVAYEMSKNTEGAVTLNQYECISNALSNYDQTGEELIEQCEGKIDAVVMATGTGGTLTGIAAKIKEKIPSCQIVGVDPIGSIIAQPDELNKEGLKSYKIEGMGHDFVPQTCVRKYVDQWIKTRDQESFELARRLIKEEGLLTGGSCGSILSAAIRYALEHDLDETKRIVIVLPDSIRNYMTKFACDEWMVDNGFYPQSTFEDPKHRLHGKQVKDLKLSTIKTHTKSLTIEEAIKLFKEGEPALVIEENGKILGGVLEATLLSVFLSKGLKPSDDISKIGLKGLPIVTLETDLSIVAKFLEKHKVVLVQQNEGVQKITALDLLTL
jgi:cystathionine beta-synthase